MTTIDRRDRRRAKKLLFVDVKGAHPYPSLDDIVPFVAAALKRERDETGMGAINWFLFSDRGTKAKAKRAIAQKYCTRKHLDKRGSD